MNTVLHEILEWLYAIVIALAIAMVIHIFFLQPTRVSGESMVPTLHNGEYLIISKMGHIMGDVPDYGDIVIIDSHTAGKGKSRCRKDTSTAWATTAITAATAGLSDRFPSITSSAESSGKQSVRAVARTTFSSRPTLALFL